MSPLCYLGRPLPLGLRLLAALGLSLLSAGLLAPFALHFVLDYLCRHTEFDGERLELRAGPGEFFVAVAKLSLLSLLSLGFYSPFAWVRFVRWLLARVESRGRSMSFAGDVPGLLFVLAWGLILSLVSLGLLFPWFVLEFARFHVDRALVGPRRFELHVPALPFLGRFWLNGVLSLVTLGVYLPWALDRELRLLLGHTDAVSATQAPADGIRTPALAMVSIVFGALLLAAARYREHLPLEALETELLRRTQAVVAPEKPPEGGRVSGAGASTGLDRSPLTTAPIEAPLEAPSDEPVDGACCSAMIPAEPELRAVTERDGTLVITNRPEAASP